MNMTDPAQPLQDVVVADAWDETPELRGVRLDLGALARQHTRPGQVIRLHAPGQRDALFALANAPNPQGYGELLLKRGSGLSDAVIEAARAGATLRATAPYGDGFPVAEAHGRHVLLFAAGSGITPIRALLQWLLAEPGHGRIALFYGARSDRDFAYRGDHAAWVAAGVHLVLCASQPSASWKGARGYVQTVARELRLHEISTDNAVAFLSGMKSMIESVRGELLRFGMPAGRTFLNF